MAKALIVIPHDCFRDEEFTAVDTALRNAGHTVAIGSSHHTEAKGHYGLLVKPDINVDFVEPSDYDAIIFIGGMGVSEFLENDHLFNTIREFFYQGKIIAAMGMAVEILAYSGVLTGRRVSCDTTTIPKVQNVGAYYTGSLSEADGQLITGSGVAGKDEFAEDLIAVLGGRRKDLYYAGTA